MSAKRRKVQNHRQAVARRRLSALIADATQDCYNDSEAATGFLCKLEESLAMPFSTRIVDVDVEVIGVDIRAETCLVAICRRGGSLKLAVPLVDLPLPSSPPAGSEWIAAYRAWIGEGESAE